MSLLYSLFSPKSKKKDKDDQGAAKQQAQPAGAAQVTAAAASPQRSLGNLALSRRGAGKGGGEKSGGQSQQAPPQADSQQRQTILAGDRDSRAPEMAEQRMAEIMRSLYQKTHEFLLKDESAAGLRERLKQIAADMIKADIDKTEYEEREKEDAKRQAEKLVEEKQVIDMAFRKYARGLSRLSGVDRLVRKELTAAAKSGYNEVKPDPSVGVDVQLEEARKRAEKRLAQEVERTVGMLLEKNKDTIRNDMQGDIKVFAKHLNVTGFGASETKLRHELDDKLVDKDTIDTIYTNKLHDPVKQAVLLKLGVGRRGWRRSKQLNEFRDKMKRAAREQAQADISNKIDQDTSIAQGTPKEFYKMMASAAAYSLAKGSVDKVMDLEAERIVKKVLPPEPTKQQLKKAAQTSAYAVARSNQSDKTKIEERALAGARAKAVELLKDAQTKAVNEARRVTKGDRQLRRDWLEAKTRSQVSKDQIADTAIKQTLEAENINKGLSVISKIIDTAVPNPGDSASFEFELKIPVYGGAYVLFGLGGEAEKEFGEIEDSGASASGGGNVTATPSGGGSSSGGSSGGGGTGSGGKADKKYHEVTVNSQITFGVGFEIFGFDSNFRAGLFMEAQGNGSVGALNLISYGLYRHMRTLSNAAADTLWGMGGRSGKDPRKEAELWAAMVEHQYMGDKNYVDVGLITKAQTEVSGGNAGFGGAIGYKRLARYNKESIDRKSPGSFGKYTDTKADQIRSGDLRHVLEFEGNAQVPFFGGSIEAGIEVSLAWIRRRLRELEISVSGSLPFQFGEDVAEWAKHVAKTGPTLAAAVKDVLGTIASRVKNEKNLAASFGGTMADTGTSMLLFNEGFEKVGADLASKLQDEETINNAVANLFREDKLEGVTSTEMTNKIALQSALSLEITISKEWDANGQPGDFEVAVELGHSKSFEVDAGVVSVAVEKSSRLAKLGGGSEGLSIELLGIPIGS